MKYTSRNVSFILFTLSIVLIIIHTACNEKSDINSPQEDIYSNPLFALIDFTDAQNAIEDATLEKDLAFNPILFNYSFLNMKSSFTEGNPSLRNAHWLSQYDFSKHLGHILRSLSLNEEQRKSVVEFTREYHNNIKSSIGIFLIAHKEIIFQANKTRKEIIDSVKNNLITREKAAADLRTLNQETKGKIANSPVTARIKNKMCSDRNILFENIKTVLTNEQLRRWNSKISSFRNPCM